MPTTFSVHSHGIRRAVKTHEAERGNLTGRGPTKAEAKADLESRIDAALSGDYDPAIVRHGDRAALIYRETDGWRYKMLDIASIPAGLSDAHARNGADTKTECVQSAAFHVIQIGSDIDSIRTDDDIPAVLADPGKRADILSCFRFYRAYRHAKNTMPDLPEWQWHQWAGQHSRDDQFA